MTRRSSVSPARRALYAKAKVQLDTKNLLDEMAAEREIPPPDTQTDLDRRARAIAKRLRKALKRSEQCEKTAQYK